MRGKDAAKVRTASAMPKFIKLFRKIKKSLIDVLR
jgi:hypothetical protein